jgi:hypothetical protein
MKERLEIREQGTGLVLMRMPVRRVEAAQVVREATTGRVVSVVAAMPEVAARPRPVLLPKVWAVADEGVPAEVPRLGLPKDGLAATGLLLLRARELDPTHDDGTVMNATPTGQERPLGTPDGPPRNGAADAVEGASVEVEQGLAFYRRYTEAMLRRYLRLSMAAGRVPSLLGRELFRGHVTSYKVRSFEDVVIFCFDMEKLLGRLRPIDQQLIKRIALQQYTQGQAAAKLRISLRNCMSGYGQALDRLTEMLLEARMLEPLESCQEAEPVVMEVSSSLWEG